MAESPRSLSCATALAAALLLLAGCSDSGPTAPRNNARPLPAAFWMTGTAESIESDGTTVSCLLELRFELAAGPRMTPEGLEYDGVHGGSIRRTVLDARGDGLSLWPSVHGAVVARSLVPDRIEITIPANAGAEGRFWRQLARIEGRFDASGRASGGWNCAPFDISEGGYVDQLYTARGSWTLVPDS